VVAVSGEVEPDSQFVCDFADIKTWVQPLIDRWDHKHLNAFIKYPSSENIATYVGWYVTNTMPMSLQFRLVVRVSETENTWAVWDSSNVYDKQRIQFAPDAEWYDPQLPSVFDVPRALEEATKRVREYFQAYQDALIIQEQLTLYKQSMTTDSELKKVVEMIANDGKADE